MKKFFYLATSLSLFLCTTVYGQDGEPTAPASRDQGFTQTMVMIGIALLFFYFILWRPEQKRRKALEEQRSSMKKGDKVVAMGIVGSISQIKDNTVVVTMVDGSKIEFLKAAISEVIPEGTEVVKEK